MKRVQVLGVLIAVGALSLTVTAYQQPAAGGGQPTRTVEVEKLKDNFYVLRGGGGNTSVLVMANGVAVVDTKNPGWGQPVIDKIKELTPKPITLIVNTHTHGDHVSGNVEYPTTAEIVVQEQTAALMKQMNPVAGLPAPPKPTPNIFTENKGRGMPKRTFKDHLTIGKGPDQIDLHFFGCGHTGGDAWVLFPALRIAAAGDDFAWNNQLPILDTNNGGCASAYPDTLMKAHAALSKGADTIVTGHMQQQMTFNDLRAWADFNREFVNQARAAKKAGQTVEQFAASWKPPANFQAPANEAAQKNAMLRLTTNAQTVYNETK
jgi:glyoxylase-like metal-dependent hydrolase (beta-lactamase superfamily II)